ncbi:hypothetical protein [Desulfatitalea tepidiphila]|uniref:hypothetical protein n=1 Tax=Desulfatitalea tepidiphila TaxID=1185843 RepID=UPI0006B5FCE4|nr:hypothetical protein [Desulfatitalea tepidiphila]
MSESIVVQLIGGVFTLLTAVVTIILQAKISRSQTDNRSHSSHPGSDLEEKRPKANRWSANPIATAVFLSALFLIGVTLIRFVIQTSPGLNRNYADLMLLVFTFALILFFAWGDAVFSLFERQAAIQLKILAVYTGIKLSYIFQYRQECLNGTQYRSWFCPNMGLPLYFDFFFNGWRLWALMAVIGGLAVEVMHRTRDQRT